MKRREIPYFATKWRIDIMFTKCLYVIASCINFRAILTELWLQDRSFMRMS